MRLHNFLIGVLVILVIVVSYLAGFLSQDFYKEVVDDYNFSKVQQQKQWEEYSKPTSYEDAIKTREEEAVKIRARLNTATNTTP